VLEVKRTYEFYSEPMCLKKKNLLFLFRAYVLEVKRTYEFYSEPMCLKLKESMRSTPSLRARFINELLFALV